MNNSNNNNCNEFLTIYNELDEFLRKELKAGVNVPHSKLIWTMAEKNKFFLRYKDDLFSFSRLRNAIVHNPDKRNAEPIADPHDFVVKKYKEILSKVVKPPKALDVIAIRSEKIYTASLNDNALDVMSVMNKNTFTHVPVIDNGKLIGVFSENTIFSYIVRMGDILLERDVKVREFSELIPIHKHESESFAFVSRETLVMEVEDMFAEQLQKGIRLAVVFITHNGDPNEKILGLITAWDIAGYQEE